MDYVGEALALGIDTLIVGVCLKLYLKNRNAVKLIQEVPVREISPELEDLVSAQPGQKLPYVAIRGSVKAIGSPIKSLNSPDVTGVVQKLSLREHVITRSTAGFWADQERTVQEAYNYVPFVLCAGSRPGSWGTAPAPAASVEVADALSADLLDLETVADRFEPSQPSLMDHLWGFFTGVRQRGLQSTEEMLREGTLVTGIGELAAAPAGEAAGAAGAPPLLRLQPPTDGAPFFLTSMPLSSLARRIDSQKRTYKVLTIVFGCVGLLIMGIAARRWWLDRLRRLQEEANRRSLEATRRDRRRRVREPNLPEEQLCVVCRMNPREMIVLPCGHVCLCEDCSDTIEDKCPVCRAVIEKKMAAYLS